MLPRSPTGISIRCAILVTKNCLMGKYESYVTLGPYGNNPMHDI